LEAKELTLRSPTEAKMSDQEKLGKFSEGPKPPEVPTVPVPGQTKSEKAADDSGLPMTVKVAAAVVTILATLAGIGFGVEAILQSNRTFQQQMAKDERDYQERSRAQERQFQLELEKQKAANEIQRSEESKQEKRVEAEKADADAKIAESKRMEADAEARKAASDLQKQTDALAAEQTKEQRAAEAEQRKERGESFTQLQAQITKLRLAKSPDEAATALTGVGGFMGADPPIRTIALEALDIRLQSFPSKIEIGIIFDSLTDAGPDGLDVAVRANRRAWKILKSSISAEIRGGHSYTIPLTKELRQKTGNETQQVPLSAEETLELIRRQIEGLYRGAPVSPVARHDFDFSLREFAKEAEASQDEASAATYYTSRSAPLVFPVARPIGNQASVPSLEVVLSMLSASRDGIERILPKALPGSTVSLDECFLPGFTPTRTTQARTVSLHDAYLAGADLRSVMLSPRSGVSLGRRAPPDPSLFAASGVGIPDGPGLGELASADVRLF
jgi:chemotaxis protein histidine kinase CheA